MAKRKLIYEAPVEMSEEESARFTAVEEQVEHDAERELREHRVNMRWAKDQVALIRRAAAIYGITYQTYIKQAAVRQAMIDLKTANEVARASSATMDKKTPS